MGSGTKYTITDVTGAYALDSSQFVEAVATQGTQGSLQVTALPGYSQGSTNVTATPPLLTVYDVDLAATGTTVDVVVRTNTAGLVFRVDDVEYTAPQTFT